jgi:hypothetical protein
VIPKTDKYFYEHGIISLNKSLLNDFIIFLLLCLSEVSVFLVSNGDNHFKELEGILFDLFRYAFICVFKSSKE